MSRSEALTPLDATFLELEQNDDASTMHIGAALVFESCPPLGRAPSIDRVRALLEQRAPLLPAFRRKLSHPHVGGLRRPEWIEDDLYDVDFHLRHATLPAPGGREELREWLADFWSHRLDRAHPLWQMALVDGLPGGRWVLATKTHHAMVDGVGSVDIGHALLDFSPEPAPPPAPVPAHPAPRPLLPAWLPAGVGLMRHPRHAAGDALALAEVLWRDEVQAARPSSINVEIGSTRRFAEVPFDLAEVKAVKRALGGTINDVVLAVAAGGLRYFLESRGDDLEAPLRAMMPVNLRADDAHDGRGNHVTSLFVDLPIGEADPLRRYHATRASATALKSGSAARGGSALVGLTGLLPPVLHAPLSQTLFAPRLFNITITNVPGPQLPLFALGAPLREVHPLVPLFSGHALGMAIVSYDGTLTFGLNADHATVPDLIRLELGLERAFGELRQLAGRGPVSRRSPSAVRA